jgi:pimeloyl-ACP methyl ester carboxylesterase
MLVFPVLGAYTSAAMCKSYILFRCVAALIASIVFATVALADEPTSRFVRRSDTSDTVIVFVHGLREDGITAWTNTNINVYWPELLSHDHSFDGSDIFVYSYPADLSTKLSIDDVVENMRAVLNVNRIPKYSRIIFLSHSMGGIVTRSYLLEYRDIAARTAFAYFFSTPTTGSEVPSMARWAFQSPQIEDLKLMGPDDYLARLMRLWQAASFSFPSYCAYEKKPTDGVMLVVDMASASALCTTVLDPIDADHGEIVKPDNQNSPSYVAFKSAYIAFKSKLEQSTTPNQDTSLPEDALISNTGTILSNRFVNNLIVNGHLDPLIITTNNGRIRDNNISNNFIDGKVDILRNTGTIDNNEVGSNTIMRGSGSNNLARGGSDALPFHILDDSHPILDRDGTFTCSFRINMESGTKINYLTIALTADGLLGMRVIGNQPTIMLNQFVGYAIWKVTNPEGVLTISARYSKQGCNHERRFSWGHPADKEQ